MGAPGWRLAHPEPEVDASEDVPVGVTDGSADRVDPVRPIGVGVDDRPGVFDELVVVARQGGGPPPAVLSPQPTLPAGRLPAAALSTPLHLGLEGPVLVER